MTKKRLLVTGHLGFIGSEFCEIYREEYEIAGVDYAGWGSMQRNLATGVKDIRGDICDPKVVRCIVEQFQPEAIVNFAAESHVDRANEDDSCFWKSNVFGARNLALEACRRGIRMVQVSTDEVYGDAVSTSKPWTEESRISPKNPYAVTKAAAEMLLCVYSESKKHNLDVVITRGANTIGPRQFPEKAVPKAVWCFTNGKPFPLFRTPARRMWMHVEDHVSGIKAAFELGKRGGIYNLAPSPGSEEITENVIERVRELVGKGEITKVEDRASYDLRYWMDASKAKHELGWEPKYDLDATLCSTVDWYLKNPDWLDEAHRALISRCKGGDAKETSITVSERDRTEVSKQRTYRIWCPQCRSTTTTHKCLNVGESIECASCRKVNVIEEICYHCGHPLTKGQGVVVPEEFNRELEVTVCWECEFWRYDIGR